MKLTPRKALLHYKHFLQAPHTVYYNHLLHLRYRHTLQWTIHSCHTQLYIHLCLPTWPRISPTLDPGFFLPPYLPYPIIRPLNIFPAVLTQTSHLLPQHISNPQSTLFNQESIKPLQPLNTAQKSKNAGKAQVFAGHRNHTTQMKKDTRCEFLWTLTLTDRVTQLS